MANILHYIIILDCSKSMKANKDNYIADFNKKIDELKLSTDTVYVTVLHFNDFFDFKYQKTPIKDILELKDDAYVLDGMTAYNDAIYKAIDYINKNVVDSASTSYYTYIISDKVENKSTEKSASDITTLISDKEATLKWTFAYTEVTR